VFQASARWPPTTNAGQFDLVGIPARRAACRRSKSPSTSTPTALSSVTRTRRQQGAADPHPGLGRLSDGDIDKMVKDAEAHAAEDKKRRELVGPRTRPTR